MQYKLIHEGGHELVTEEIDVARRYASTEGWSVQPPVEPIAGFYDGVGNAAAESNPKGKGASKGKVKAAGK